MNEYSLEASYDIRGKKGHFKVTLLNVDFNTNDGQFITKIAEAFYTLLFWFYISGFPIFVTGSPLTQFKFYLLGPHLPDWVSRSGLGRQDCTSSGTDSEQRKIEGAWVTCTNNYQNSYSPKDIPIPEPLKWGTLSFDVATLCLIFCHSPLETIQWKAIKLK